MLAALVTTIAAPDHWGGNHPDDGDSDAAAHHAQHCHGSAASCSDVPLTTIGGLAFLAAALAVAGSHYVRRPDAAPLARLLGWNSRVPSPPPKLALAS
jgi:hypothetical protein